MEEKGGVCACNHRQDAGSGGAGRTQGSSFADTLGGRVARVRATGTTATPTDFPREEPATPRRRFREDVGSKELHFGGTVLFGFIVWLCSVHPGMVPLFYMAYCAVALPMRAFKYVRLRWTFFLCDFCYLVNAVCLVHLALFPLNRYLAALSFMLADGPVAGAIIAWRTSWVFSSPEHVISVMIHLLPGIALFTNRVSAGPKGLSECLAAARDLAYAPFSGAPLAAASSVMERYSMPPAPDTWTLSPAGVVVSMGILPLAFYVAWQLLYWLIVQVALQGLFRKDKRYMTSFKWLTTRNNSWIFRHVNKGRPRRRIVMFGLLQLAYTVVTFAAVMPLYRSFWGVMAWQIAKTAFALWYGAQYQCEAIPKKIQRKVLKQYEVADTQGEEVNRDTLNSIATSASPVVEATVLDASYMAKHPEGWAIAAGAADAG